MERISNIPRPLDGDNAGLKEAVAKKLRCKASDFTVFRIVRKSIDARDKADIHFVYAVEYSFDDTDRAYKEGLDDDAANIISIRGQSLMKADKKSGGQRPVIAGSGPAGLFAALTLAENGHEPIVLERGGNVDARARAVSEFFETGRLSTVSNVQFGEGGAGTFSDGKLTTQINNPLNGRVLSVFVAHGAPEEILYEAKPHIGTDKLAGVIKALRETIKALGGTFYFETQLTDIIIDDGKLRGVVAGTRNFETDTLILAIGHSARDTFTILGNKGIDIVQKPFAVGVRIEHLQEAIDKSQFGGFAGHPALGAAEYKLAMHRPAGRSAYTFCMCPGGVVVASSSHENSVVTNGMSSYARNGINANSALLVQVTPNDYSDGVAFQQKLEEAAYQAGGCNYKAPAQRVEDFIAKRPSKRFGDVLPTYRPGVIPCDLGDLLPEYIADTLRQAIVEMDKRMRGFASPDAVLTGVETRSSSPIRILRNEAMMSSIHGIYPCGEGCGYAGGIMSAAMDGIRVAHACMEG